MIALAALGASTAAGFSLFRLMPGRVHPFETLAWSFTLGLLVQGGLAAVFFAAGMAPGTPTFLVFDTLLVVASFTLRPRRAPVGAIADAARPDWPVVLLGTLAAAGALLFLMEAASVPPDATDYLAIWGLKAKTIAGSGSIPARLFHDPALVWAHPEYPLLVPLTLAAIARFAGRWTETGTVLFYFLCEAATLGVLFGFRARRGSPLRGSLAAALAALCFGLYERGNLGTAEIPMALGWVLLVEAFLDALAQAPGSLFRLSAAAFYCASVKKEGAVLPILFALWALVASGAPRRVRARTAFAAMLPPLSHAAILWLAIGPVRARDFDLGLAHPTRWGELPPRLLEAAARILSVSLLPALPALVAIALFFIATRRADGEILLPPMALQVLIYGTACAFSAFSVRWHVDSSFSRITLALFPAAALVISGRVLLRPARAEPSPARRIV